jgi:hypothetical protein
MTNLKKTFILTISIFAILTILGCSSDIFEIVKVPEIESMSFSAYEVDPGDSVRITLKVKDTDEILHYNWSASGGDFIPPTDQVEVIWKAPREGGQYRITVKVSNEKKSTTKSQNVTVRSYTEPVVEILVPQNGDYLIQHSEITIQVFAQHNNGISHLDFFIDDTLKKTINGHIVSSEYEFPYQCSESPGEKEIKIEAFANITGTVGRDSIQVVIEGIVLGKDK